MNTYTLFYSKLEELIKKGGFWGFITPAGWYTNNPYEKLREWFFKKNKILQIVDFPYRFFPFDDVNTETAIVVGINQYEQNNSIKILTGDKKILNKTHQITLNLQVNSVTQDDVWQILYYKFYIYQTKITCKLDKIKSLLGEIIEVHNPSSLDRKSRYPRTKVDYDKCVFSEIELSNDSELKKISKSCLEGDDIQRYYLIENKKFTNIIWKDNHGNEKKLNAKTFSWMNQFKIVGQRITGQVSRRFIFAIDFTQKITMPSVNLILLKNSSNKSNDEIKKMLYYVLSILNSKLLNYHYENKYGEANTNITSDVLEESPIIIGSNKNEIIKKTIFMVEMNKKLYEKNQKFQNRIRDNLRVKNMPPKFDKIYLINFKEFLDELKKAKIKLSLNQQDEWQNYFEQHKIDLTNLKLKIDKTDLEIDQIIYKLYGLTEAEIKIVEESI